MAHDYVDLHIGTENVKGNDKPRICDVLGVEVGESFIIKSFSDNVAFRIDENGYFVTNPSFVAGASFAVMDAINDPETVVRKPRLTQDELTLCRIIGAKWVSRDKYSPFPDRVGLWKSEPELHPILGFTSAINLASVNESTFPSVRPGDCIHVEPLLAEAHDNKGEGS